MVRMPTAVSGRGDPWAGDEDPAPDPERFYGAVLTEYEPPIGGPMNPYAVPHQSGPDGQLGREQPVPAQDGRPVQDGQPVPQEDASYREEDVQWFPVPPELLDFVAVGAVHTGEQCPLWIVRLLADDEEREFEFNGSSEGLLNLAECLTQNVTNVACFASHLHGPQPLRGPVARPCGGQEQR
jgi:hypothetical protein